MKTYTQKEVIAILKRIERRLKKDGIDDCEKAITEDALESRWTECLKHEGAIYAYQWVIDEIVDRELVKIEEN